MNQKVYFTCLHLGHGGVEMAISLLSNALCKRGYDVEILCTYNFGAPAYQLDSKVKVTYLTNVLPNKEAFHTAMKHKNPFKILKEGLYATRVLFLKKYCLKKAIQSIRDGIIVSTRHEDTLLLSKYGQDNVLKIAQLHHDHHFSQKLFEDFKHRYTNIDYFALLTDTLRDEISELMHPHNSKTKCVTIPNFLSFEKGQELTRKQNQVVAVGRLHTDKAFHRLIDIWAIVNKTHPEWTLKIIGDGPLKEELYTQVQSYGLTDTVIFTGPLNHDAVMDEMAASSIYAMTSISEAFPFVLLEAMYNYLPIVAYDIRVGPRALVKDQKTGYLIPDGDAIAFANALCKLMDEPQIMTSFQKDAHHFVKSFSEESVVELWLSIFSNNRDTL